MAAGCGGSGALDPTPGVTDARRGGGVARGAVAAPMPEVTVGTSSRAGSAEEDAAGDGTPFVARTRDEGGEGSAADGLLAVRHGVHEGYERVVLDLGVGKEPAGTVPRWSLLTPEGDGLLRVSLPSVSSTGVSDGELGDGFLSGFHVARSPEGGVFVDIVSREAFSYRILELTSPARLVIDFKSTGARPEIPPPAEGGKTVLTSPRSGEDVADPLTIEGYSRNFEGHNEVSLLDASGRVIAGGEASSSDWSATWGSFETTLDLPDFQGRATLRVGTHSARDGSFEGVEIPVYGS